MGHAGGQFTEGRQTVGAPQLFLGLEKDVSLLPQFAMGLIEPQKSTFIPHSLISLHLAQHPRDAADQEKEEKLHVIVDIQKRVMPVQEQVR
jgi:hypothetical protein